MIAYGRGVVVPQYPDPLQTNLVFSDNQRLPTRDFKVPLIAAAWGLTFFDSKTVMYTKTIGAEGARKFILTFEYLEGWGKHISNERTRLDYQLVFHEDSGRITANYKLLYSDNPLNANGLRNTLGIQASPLVGVTFSHNAAVAGQPLTIEYVPGAGGTGDGGGNGGGDNGGGGTGPTNPGGNGGAGNSQPNPTFNLLFSFAQRKAGSLLRFDVQSSDMAAKQALNDCSFSVLAGQGTLATTTTYRPLGTVSGLQGSRTIDLKRFTQAAQAPQSKSTKQRGIVQNLFLRAGAVCSSGRLSLLSQPIQVRTSKAKTALPPTRWMQRLAANLRGQ